MRLRLGLALFCVEMTLAYQWSSHVWACAGCTGLAAMLGIRVGPRLFAVALALRVTAAVVMSGQAATLLRGALCQLPSLGLLIALWYLAPRRSRDWSQGLPGRTLSRQPTSTWLPVRAPVARAPVLTPTEDLNEKGPLSGSRARAARAP